MASQPKTLVSWYTTPDYIPPLRITEDQTTIGPQFKPAGADTERFDYHTPSGQYDLAQTLCEQGAPHAFDLIVVYTDASCTNLPRNLDAVTGRKVLVVGDTHHLKKPLQRMIGYAQAEPYEFIISSHNRHHLHWFVEAGCAKVAWIPAAQIRHTPRQFSRERQSRVALVGQLGQYHQRRARLVEYLKQHQVPTLAGPAAREAAADLYAQSVISLNCSLNADLNLRVFEILSAGGFLLTDKLAPESGLEMLFQEDEEYVSYSSAEELLEKANYYLQHPEDAENIAGRGHERFLAEHLPKMKTSAILSWVFENELDPRHTIVRRQTESSVSLGQRIMFYETMQEAHQNREKTRILFECTSDKAFISDVRDLPRVCVSRLSNSEDRSNQPAVSELAGVEHLTECEALAACWDFVVWPEAKKQDLNAKNFRTSTVICL